MFLVDSFSCSHHIQFVWLVYVFNFSMKEGKYLTYVSFCLASSLPIEEIVVWAHDVGAKVLVDACQSVPHMVVDVQKLNADFLVASSHKVGIVYFSS